MDVKQKQFFMFKLLNNIMGPVMYKDIEDIGKNFKIEDNMECYSVSFKKNCNIFTLEVGFCKLLFVLLSKLFLILIYRNTM